MRAETPGHIAPRRSRAFDPADTIEDSEVGFRGARSTGSSAGQKRVETRPLFAAQLHVFPRNRGLLTIRDEGYLGQLCPFEGLALVKQVMANCQIAPLVSGWFLVVLKLP